MPACMRLLLVLLLAVLAAGQGRPALKIGTTMAHCGTTTANPPISVNIEKALFWFANYTNLHGGIVINNTVHDLQIISYNDATDQQLMGILYERLVTVDQVDLLLGPFGTGDAAFAVAAKYGIPIINIGDFGYYIQDKAPNGTFGGWLFSTIPNLLTIAAPCYALLRQAGANAMTSVWTEAVGSAGLDVISLSTAQAIGIEALQPVISLKTDLSNMEASIDQIVQQNADVLSGGMYNDAENVALLTALIDAKYTPAATVLWVGPAFESFRSLAGWKAGFTLYPGPWSPSLNYSDSLFGNSQGFNQAFQEGLGRQPDTTDIIAMFALSVYKLAVEKAESKDADDVRQALLTLNDETWFGTANFTAVPLQQTNAASYCFQLSSDASEVYPVSPNARGYRQLVYPAVLSIPGDYYPQKSYRTLRLSLGIGLGVGIPVVAMVLVGLYVIFVRYQVVFIPKQEESKGEW